MDLDSVFIPNKGRIVPTHNNLRSKLPIQKDIKIFLLPLKSIPLTNLHDFGDLASGSYSVESGVRHQCNNAEIISSYLTDLILPYFSDFFSVFSSVSSHLVIQN